MSKRPVPVPSRFESLSALVPVVTETQSLRDTVKIMADNVGDDVAETLLLTCAKTSVESQCLCEELVEAPPFGRFRIVRQRRPFLGNAFREAFDAATTSHVVMMASDLETHPLDLAPMIALAKAHPAAIITASRWADGGAFAREGTSNPYGSLRVALNWTFQHLAATLYRVQLTDLTFGYRIFPTELMQAIRWRGERHNFLLETVLKPLRLGVDVLETSARWEPRTDGESQNDLRKQAEYVLTLFANRLVPSDRII